MISIKKFNIFQKYSVFLRSAQTVETELNWIEIHFHEKLLIWKVLIVALV